MYMPPSPKDSDEARVASEARKACDKSDE